MLKKVQNLLSREVLTSIVRWFDSEAGASNLQTGHEKQVDWVRILPLIALHAGCLAVFIVGWSPVAVFTAIALYFVRMFAITGFYHRYFSHKTFKTSRPWQFVFAVLGNSSAQRGPLWWAAHHRHHHRHTDQPDDPHSPKQHGFWWSHIGWLTSQSNFATRYQYVRDWSVFPELRWINRFDVVVPLVLALFLFLWGALLNGLFPGLGTNGPQMLVWGFFVSSTVLLHGTCMVNSVAHLSGRRRYDTSDTSRNSWLTSLVTLGEGWHNNHHHYAVSARQGFFWWEIDITYYLLLLMAKMGIIHDLRPVPERVRKAAARQG
jgi:stearoyl-CoA desaturase (delta-9 desaturase)